VPLGHLAIFTASQGLQTLDTPDTTLKAHDVPVFCAVKQFTLAQYD
jgi:hypothetical protein